MQTNDITNSIIPTAYNKFFEDHGNKMLAELLSNYILFDIKPITSPALWQDVAIFIRFKKRDVWSLSQEQFKNAHYAICFYTAKYIIEHLKKPKILEVLNRFFAQSPEEEPIQPLSDFFTQIFHAPVDSLFLTQERIIVDKDSLAQFDSFFEYPCWLEFTNEAKKTLFDKILQNKLSDEQIDYFLGASDNLQDYDQWFKVTKHILTTSHNSHTFWTAGDVLSIIKKAIPEDEKSKKWFDDQVFEIFWPHVNSAWPLLNEGSINFDSDDELKITQDSIGWLKTIPDLTARLPELGDNFELYQEESDISKYVYYRSLLKGNIENGKTPCGDIVNLFFTLSDYATNVDAISEMEDIANSELIPLVKKSMPNSGTVVSLINRAIKHAKTHLEDLARESKNLAKLIAA